MYCYSHACIPRCHFLHLLNVETLILICKELMIKVCFGSYSIHIHLKQSTFVILGYQIKHSAIPIYIQINLSSILHIL